MAHDADRLRPMPAAFHSSATIDRCIDVLEQLVAVARLETLGDARPVDLGGEEGALVHRRRERAGRRPCLRARRVTTRLLPACVPPKWLLGGRGEGLVGALQDPLGPDVDPRARRSSDRTSSCPRPPAIPEVLPVRPAAYEVRVGDQDARGGCRVVRNTPTGLPDCTRSVSSVLEAPQGGDDRCGKQSQSRAALPLPP